MKNLIIILFIFTVVKNCTSQNLVANPSFESFTACPTGGGQLNLATPWYNPSITGDPDYFNSCAPAGMLSVPYQTFGSFQYANTGNGIAGFWCYRVSIVNLREYTQIQLANPLIAGDCYYVSFYINLVNWAGYACNNVGCYFSNSPVSTSGSDYILNFPNSLKGFKNKVVADTLNWQNIAGVFVANGGENYLTVGNFNDDSLTDAIQVNPSAPADGAYYFIDDVSVIHIDSIIGSMAAFAGNDTTIINGDSVFIGQEITNLYCNWYIGTTLIADSVSGLYVNPTVNTTYIVEQNLCGNITYDTVTVYVSGVGINENDWGSKINLYPNPNNGNFTIDFLQTSNYLIEITNSVGACVYKAKTSTKKCSIDATFGSGVYVLKIYDINKNTGVFKKLVIQ